MLALIYSLQVAQPEGAAAAAQLRPCMGWLVSLGHGIGVGVEGLPNGCRSVGQAAAGMLPGARCAAANDVVFATVINPER